MMPPAIPPEREASVVSRRHSKRGGRFTPATMPWLVFWMALAIVTVAGLAFWDEEREAAAALDDFAHEQAVVAKSIAAALDRLQDPTKPAGDSAGVDAALLAGLAHVEGPGSLTFLVQEPGVAGLLAIGGARVRVPTLESAMRSGAPSHRLSRSEASLIGLPARTAMAGLGAIDAGARGRFGIAVIATARRERDRELRARWRLVLGVTIASGLVLAFGGLALRKQRKELELEYDIELGIVERERDERLVHADKLATMGALATGIAHEVSTPLGVIAGRAEQLLPRVESDPRARHAVQAILDQTDRISRIVRGFLALARGELPTLERLDPRSLALASLDLVEHRFAKADVSLSSHVADGLPKIACEPRLFEQVLVNLLLNACDACEPGGHVNVRVEGDSERVTFVVTDDGSGIHADDAARATEPFFTTKPPGKGSGLGLAIANEIVKHHNGDLTLRSRTADDTSSPARGDDARSPRTSDLPPRGTRACVTVPSSMELHHG